MKVKPHADFCMIFLALALLMAFSRFSHEGTATVLPDASLAVFFLAGFYLNVIYPFVLLAILAFIIDYIAITTLGVSSYCVSPAYFFLVPTYGVMWLAGRWLARQINQSWATYGTMLGASLGLSASVAFIISNGSFFWFSGKVSLVSVFEYANGLSDQYLPYVGATVFYAVTGLSIGVLLRKAANPRLANTDFLKSYEKI